MNKNQFNSTHFYILKRKHQPSRFKLVNLDFILSNKSFFIWIHYSSSSVLNFSFMELILHAYFHYFVFFLFVLFLLYEKEENMKKYNSKGFKEKICIILLIIFHYKYYTKSPYSIHNEESKKYINYSE